MAKNAQPHWFHLFVAGAFTLVGLFLLVWAFVSGHVTPTQYTILRWFVGPITGLAAGAFTGQIKISESRVGNVLVSATGGFAVWLLFLWFTPTPSETLVTILLYRNGHPVTEQRRVTVEFADQRRTETAVDGQVMFRLPSHINQLEAVQVEGEFVEGGNNTPRPIKSDQSIRINLSSANSADAPTVKPTELPDPKAFVAMLPTKETVLGPRAKDLTAPADVRLSYENLSDTSLDLYILDCWAYYTNSEPLWRIWKMPARGQAQDFDSFDNHMTGYFCFGVRKMDTKDGFTTLGCEQLFDTTHPRLTLSGNYPNIKLSFDKQP